MPGTDRSKRQRGATMRGVLSGRALLPHCAAGADGSASVRAGLRPRRRRSVGMSGGTPPPAGLTVHAIAARIADRRLSPVDLVDDCLARIERLEPKLQAFAEVYAADARLAAEAADKAIRSGHAAGPLHGIPIALKDLVEVEGKIVTGGSAVWRDRRAGRTATLARRLIAAGMIVIGKTHTVEFAYGGWGTNQHLGTPHNPWDPSEARTPGGSSSGSGVAVAARPAARL